MVNENRPTVSLTPEEQEALEIEIESVSQQYAILPHPLQQQYLSLLCWNFDNDGGTMQTMKTLVELISEISETICLEENQEHRQRKLFQLTRLKTLYYLLHAIALAPCLP